MKFIGYRNINDEVIFLLHGGGLAPWNYFEEAMLLQEKYHIIIPVLDGHKGSDRDFTTIEENTRSIIAYIDKRFGGEVFLIGGLSLGGQILVEMLSQCKDICQYAIVESALVLPMKIISQIIKPTFDLSYPLIKRRWFAKLQFDSLHMKPSLFEAYFKDSTAISKKNMIAFLMANANYKMKLSLVNCRAKMLVLVGAKERNIMKKSDEIICQSVPSSSLEIMQGFYHGTLSINHPDLYVEKIYHLTGHC